MPVIKEPGYQYKETKKRFLKEAKTRFENEEPQHGSYKDYKKAFDKHRVT